MGGAARGTAAKRLASWSSTCRRCRVRRVRRQRWGSREKVASSEPTRYSATHADGSKEAACPVVRIERVAKQAGRTVPQIPGGKPSCAACLPASSLASDKEVTCEGCACS